MTTQPEPIAPTRSLPVRPDLDQLRRQAKELLAQFKIGDPTALEEFAHFHPRPREGAPKLSDAQVVLARSYGVPSWSRLVQACQLIDAIWNDNLPALLDLLTKHPTLLQQPALVTERNWGRPMAYAANLGRNEIITKLHSLGASDLQHAFERACLRGQLDTARLLHQLGARPAEDSILGPCETLNADGLALLLELGAPMPDPKVAIALVLQTYSRNADGKHRCLALLESISEPLPDTPTMALHCGRLDLLQAHLAKTPDLFKQQFSHEEIFPLALGCDTDHSLALHGSPLANGTLLHLCVDYDEFEIANWILKNGGDPNATSGYDEDGFGGPTALFGAVISQPFRVGVQGHERFAELLLTHGADPSIRASLRKSLRFVADESTHEYRNVTALEFGQQFHDQDWVNPKVMRLLA